MLMLTTKTEKDRKRQKNKNRKVLNKMTKISELYNPITIMSNDPAVENYIDNAKPKPVPKTILCEFCGAERYSRGNITIWGEIAWNQNPIPCTCAKAVELHEQERLEAEAAKEAEARAKEKRLMQEHVNSLIGKSGMGERFRFLQCTFDTYIVENDYSQKIKTATQAYAVNFDKMLPRRGEPLPNKNGMLITGKTGGVGKTHIAAAIANYLLNQGTDVIFMTERNLFGKIQETYGNNMKNSRYSTYDDQQTESQIRHIYETVPLLIIDDLGVEKPSEWTLSMLYTIINERYDRALPTIITTKYDTVNLIKKLTPIGSDTSIAESIVDRLMEMCKSIEIQGDSWRSRL